MGVVKQKFNSKSIRFVGYAIVRIKVSKITHAFNKFNYYNISEDLKEILKTSHFITTRRK